MNKMTSPVDPDGLMEFSVVFTDRSLNHMSRTFQGVMTDLYAMLRDVYQAEAAVIVPGGGTFGMEAVARQFATDQKVMVIRNGWFSYRWTQIFDMGSIPSETTVINGGQVGNENHFGFCAAAGSKWSPQKFREERPGVVFAPHVETSSGVFCLTISSGHCGAAQSRRLSGSIACSAAWATYQTGPFLIRPQR